MSGPILVPVDLSPVSLRVTEEAAALAQCMATSVILLHVEPPDPAFVGYEPGPKSVRDAVVRDIRGDDERLHALRDGLRAKGIDTECLLIQGPAVEKILEESERVDAAYIVIGSHGHGALHDLVVGSVCGGVVRRSRRPILIVPRDIRA
jgi:nucleotide-binding universal stress UspA family protein